MRLRIPSRRRDTQFFTRLVSALRAGPATHDVSVNPTTGSILITDIGDLSLDSVLRDAQAQGLFTLPDRQAKRVAETLIEGARRLNEVVRRASGDRIDLRELVAVSFIGGAAYQLLRREVLPPASTLAWYAAAILALPQVGSEKEVVERIMK